MAMHGSQAAYWSAFCAGRFDGDPRRFLADPWIRRTLADAASDKSPIGIDGFLWRFPDRSRLIVTTEIVQAADR